MSVKKTPISFRYNRIINSNNLTPKENSSKKNGRINNHAIVRKSSVNLNETLDKNENETNIFNMAFSGPSSATKTPTSVPKFKPKTSTALNACYTPSSLYRSTKNTPSSVRSSARTPVATPRSDIKKLRKTPDCTSSTKKSDPNRDSVQTSGRISDDVISRNNLSKSTRDGEISNLTVAVRVRPLNSQECLNPTVANIVRVNNNEVTILAGTSADNTAGVSHCFHYDHAFYSSNSENKNFANQEAVFKGTGLPLIDNAFEGYNACLFAYGQTGSGKSYSMMGIEIDESDDINCNSEAGIIPRFCHELFRRIEANKDKIQAEIEVSYFEIYNEKIHDLLCVSQTENGSTLNGNSQKSALKVREHPVWGPYVVDLSTHPVDSYNALRNWLAVGNSQRATAATGMNDKSSRSHSIFNIVLNLSELDTTTMDKTKRIKQTRRSKISLVDLAGSERISHAGASGERIREGVSINKSLLILGKVIAALADTKKFGGFVPYRESVLTWLLRESLGGNSRTVMLATISPASMHLDETLATLRYACQARTIVNRVKINEDPHNKVIRELRQEIERLQAIQQDCERQKRLSANGINAVPRKIIIETSVDESELDALRQKLNETEKELLHAQKPWMDRLKEAEDLRKSEMRMLQRKGLAMELSAEQKQACLVNLAADPMLSGILFYILPTGMVHIGRSRPSAFPQPDIVLEGPLVAFRHCTIEHINGLLYIVPDNEEFETYLNGELVNEKRQMFHGDRLVIGGSHYFRISNPFCSKKNKDKVVDFQTAHEEILRKQEDQLRRELNEEKRIALTQIELERAANERNYKERMDMLELERFKFNCNKELLETEKRAMSEENANEKFEYTPYKSTLLDDIKRMMEHPTEESLHKTQLMVKEATQRCRNLGIQLEFRQSQNLDEFGIFRAVVMIIDKENSRKAEWPTARLEVWLDIVRDNDITKENIFQCVDIDWMPIDENFDESINESLNSSKISLNLSYVKEAISKNPCQGFKHLRGGSPFGSGRKENLNKSAIFNSSKCRNIKKKFLTYDDEENLSGIANQSETIPTSNQNDFNSIASDYLRDIQHSVLNLKKLTERHNGQKNAPIKNSIQELEKILAGVKTMIDENTAFESSPTKTPKIVRFLLD